MSQRHRTMSNDSLRATRRSLPTCRERDLFLGYRIFAAVLAPAVLTDIQRQHGEILIRATRDANHPFWGEHWHEIERRLITACSAKLRPGLRFGQSSHDPTEIGVFDETDC